jgi:AraC-binding-like domain
LQDRRAGERAGLVAQDGRQAALAPGDLTLVDLSRPARWRMSAMRVVAVVFPRALLPLRPGEVAGLTAVRFPGDEGTGALVSSLARQLVRRLDDWAVADGARLGTAVLDLLTVALAARLDRAAQVPPETRQRALLHRIHAFIEARLGDPELKPGTIAAAHHVSLRYLYKLFETDTNCSRPSRPAWPAGSGSGGWSAAAATWWTRPWRPGR